MGEYSFNTPATKNPTIGNWYHVAGHKRGAVYVLMLTFKDGSCIVQTPRTKRRIKVRLSDLRLLDRRANKYRAQ